MGDAWSLFERIEPSIETAVHGGEFGVALHDWHLLTHLPAGMPLRVALGPSLVTTMGLLGVAAGLKLGKAGAWDLFADLASYPDHVYWRSTYAKSGAQLYLDRLAAVDPDAAARVVQQHPDAFGLFRNPHKWDALAAAAVQARQDLEAAKRQLIQSAGLLSTKIESTPPIGSMGFTPNVFQTPTPAAADALQLAPLLAPPLSTLPPPQVSVQPTWTQHSLDEPPQYCSGIEQALDLLRAGDRGGYCPALPELQLFNPASALMLGIPPAGFPPYSSLQPLRLSNPEVSWSSAWAGPSAWSTTSGISPPFTGIFAPPPFPTSNFGGPSSSGYSFPTPFALPIAGGISLGTSANLLDAGSGSFAGNLFPGAGFNAGTNWNWGSGAAPGSSSIALAYNPPAPWLTGTSAPSAVGGIGAPGIGSLFAGSGALGGMLAGSIASAPMIQGLAAGSPAWLGGGGWPGPAGPFGGVGGPNFG